MLAALIPLVSLLAPLIPSIGRLISGTDGEQVAGKIADVVTTIAGGTTPDDLHAALQDPSKASELLVQLQRIEAEAEKARRDADAAELVARLADVSGARSQTVELAKAGSPLAWGAAAVSMFILLVFGVVVAAEIGGYPVSEMTRRLIEYLLIAVAGYWLGSSAGSADKSRLLGAGPLARQPGGRQ